MKDTELLKKITQLRSVIAEHAQAYYVHDAPTTSDAVYDSLVRELKSLEQEHPELADPNFIIYRVGGTALDKFQKKNHTKRMLSLNDAFSYQEIDEWILRIEKLLLGKPVTYFCELKLDGLACALHYDDGILTSAITRGDGSVGEDITQNVKTISQVPLVLHGMHHGHTEVRGEIVMSRATLERLNTRYATQGRPLLANTRNAAAGSVRQLDPRLARERSLDFFAWDLVDSSQDTHSQAHARLREIGFMVAPLEAVCKRKSDIVSFIEAFTKERKTFAYNTDGIVVQVNELALQQTLGVVGKAPRYALAYKYPAEQVTTQVIDITVQVGRTGVLTPLAHFVPTLVAGSTVSKATLHNVEQIERLDLRIGDTVILQKAGDVIPEVVEVIKKLRPQKTTAFVMPKHCPECGEPVERRVGASGAASVAYYCTNDACPAKETRGITHFVHTMEIYEVGSKIVERLQEEGLISDAADLFTLSEADLADLERFGAKSAENIVREIQSKKHPPLDRFIAALGIVHVGEQTARDIALHFGSWEKFWSASRGELDSIENIGPAVIESISTYRTSHHGKFFIQKLFATGVEPQVMKVQKGGMFVGKTFVLTGTLPTLSREDAKKIIQNNGGKVASSVSAKTDYVLMGENAGAKADEAQKLGIQTISEGEFQKMVKK